MIGALRIGRPFGVLHRTMAFNVSRMAFLGVGQQINIKLLSSRYRTDCQPSYYSVSSTSKEDFSVPKEISVPVPWGHIAGM